MITINVETFCSENMCYKSFNENMMISEPSYLLYSSILTLKSVL